MRSKCLFKFKLMTISMSLRCNTHKLLHSDFRLWFKDVQKPCRRIQAWPPPRQRLPFICKIISTFTVSSSKVCTRTNKQNANWYRQIQCSRPPRGAAVFIKTFVLQRYQNLSTHIHIAWKSQMAHYSQYSALATKSRVLLCIGERGGGDIAALGLRDYLKLSQTVLIMLVSLNFSCRGPWKMGPLLDRCGSPQISVWHPALQRPRWNSPALQGVELAHQFDQRVGGRFGDQGGDSAGAGRLRGAALPLCPVWARWVLQGPSLKT